MALEDNEITAPFISLIHREHAKYINENVKEDGFPPFRYSFPFG